GTGGGAFLIEIKRAAPAVGPSKGIEDGAMAELFRGCRTRPRAGISFGFRLNAAAVARPGRKRSGAPRRSKRRPILGKSLRFRGEPALAVHPYEQALTPNRKS